MTCAVRECIADSMYNQLTENGRNVCCKVVKWQRNKENKANYKIRLFGCKGSGNMFVDPLNLKGFFSKKKRAKTNGQKSHMGLLKLTGETLFLYHFA